MKQLLAVFVLFALLGPAAAGAQGYAITIYSDPAGTDCFLIDHAAGLVSIYVFHEIGTPGGALGSEFRLAQGTDVTLIWVGETLLDGGIHFGDTRTGVQIGYGACRTGHLHVATVNYFAFGTSAVCGEMAVCSSLLAADVAGLSCTDGWQSIGAGGLYVNSDYVSCSCIVARPGATASAPMQSVCALPVGVEETTWGRIKALYE